MGQSSSSRRNNQYVSPSQLLSSSSASPNPPANSFSGFSSPPPPPPPPLPRPTTAAAAAGASSTTTFSGFSASLPPPRPSHTFAANATYPSPPYPPPSTHPAPFHSQFLPAYSNAPSYAAPPSGYRPDYPYYPSQNHGWSPFRPSSSQGVSPMPQLPLVEHHRATTVKNDVNLLKDTIRLEADEHKPDTHLVTFTYDASVDGSFTIFYFAKEGANCNFSPLYPEYCTPVTVPFQKGTGQKFCQPSGTGIDLGFFVLEELSKPTPDNGFPLVISAEACQSSFPIDGQLGQPPSTGNAQITEAVIEKQNGNTFKVKVVKQILWVNAVRYELHELFGIEQSALEEFDDDESGKECVICLSEPKDTAVLPCRHLCMCSECAKVLRFQTNRCPICRQPVEKLMEIKMKKDNQ